MKSRFLSSSLLAASVIPILLDKLLRVLIFSWRAISSHRQPSYLSGTSQKARSTTAHPKIENAQPDSKLTSEFNAELVHTFLKRMSYQPSAPFIPPNKPLQEALTSHLTKTFGHDSALLASLLRIVPLCAAFGDLVYRHHPLPVKTYVSLFTVYLVYIDDSADRNPTVMIPELEKIVPTLLTGSKHPPPHPVLAELIDHIFHNTPRHYGPYPTTIIIKATFDFFVGTLVEARFPQGLGRPATSRAPPGLSFPRFLRLKTGVSEAYSHMLFPHALFPSDAWLKIYLPLIPSLIELLDMSNDILSFYKEWVVGDEENIYFVNAAKERGGSSADAIDVLREVMERVPALKMAVDEELVAAEVRVRGNCGSGEKAVRIDKAFRWFVRGFLMWHVSQSRYRLGELAVGPRAEQGGM